MLEIPSRTSLAALTEAANAVVPTLAIGFVRALADDRVAALHSHPYGIIEYQLAASDLPDVFSLQHADVRQADGDTIRANPDAPIGWQFTISDVRRVVSFALTSVDTPTRFWVGLRDDTEPTSEQLHALERVADDAGTALSSVRTTATQEVEHLHRLEIVAGLLPTLLTVLDIREVFDRVSSISQAALPHEMLTLGLFNEDLTQLTLYARSGHGSDTGRTFPQPYPKAVIQNFVFDIIDNRAEFPLERERPPTTLGMRSSLRIPIAVDGRTIGGIGFHAPEHARYDLADVAVGRRLADHVAVAIVHHQLAEEGRRVAALQERTKNLELLDELLAALIDSGDLRDVFERISVIAGKVLAHDAVALLVRTPDGHDHHAYAIRGFPAAPAVTPLLQELLDDPDWDHDLFDDVSLLDARHAGLVTMGFRSLLRVPIRLDGRFAGALVFFSKPVAAFKQTDVPVARRIADRMAVTLARERVVEASKRADEATARAAKLEGRVRALTEELDVRTGYRRVVGESKQWRQVLTQAAQVAATETTVLLLGESGTGKEVVARFLHRGSSRDSGPFIALNCAALPEQLLEAELFGYERGAYTGATQSKPGQLEQAAGGTLFLDEVGEMSLPAQAKFLRVLQEREFQRLGGTRVLRTDARIVAATNRDLRRAITHGQFREDLYYRLNVFAINLPALRDRRDDVLPLSEAFLNEIGRGLGRPPGGISREARQLLVDYHWPGNVRELRNILERAAILCDGGLITPEYLALTAPAPAPPPPITVSNVQVTAAATAAQPSSAKDLLDMERAMIEQALQTARFNKSKAAKALGMTRHQLYLRMQKYGLE